MKYKGFYFLLFKGPMKKVLIEKYDKEYASEIIKNSKKIYRELVKNMDDIGEDNPMAYNEMFALVFVAPYIASEKNSTGDHPGNDAPISLFCQMVFFLD